jgi:hypothetical protein
MRPKIVVAILLLGAGLIGLIFLLSKPGPQSTASAPSPAAAASPTAGSSPVTASVAAVAGNPVAPTASNPPPAVAATVVSTNDAEAHEKYVEKKIEELDAWSMNSDVKSRDAILSELKNNPDKTIRKAALEAAIQFNDRSVVPFMKDIAAQTQDPEEKTAILEAIDYINLPSLTEYMKAHPRPNTPAPPASQTSGRGTRQ